jgi:hypothetical protein
MKSIFFKSLFFRKNWSLNLIVLAIMAIGLAACNDSNPPIPVEYKKVNISSKPSVKEVSFFIDGTESMAGFASASQYLELIKSLENSVTNLPNFEEKIDAYKFASSVDKTKINKNERLIKLLTKSSFYTGSDQITRIQNVLIAQHIPYDKEKLAVIITDLLQDQTDVGLVVKQIKPYLKKGLSVGLIGVNSNFDGKLFDFIPNQPNEEIKYKGLRPVYAIVIGEAIDISKYFELVKNLSPTLKQKGKFTVFSSQSLEREIDFFGQNPFNISNNLINNGKLDNTDINSFDFKDDGQPLSFSVCVIKPTPLSEDVAGYVESQQRGWESQFETDITIKRYNNSTNSKTTVSESMPNANDYVKIKSESSQNNQECKATSISFGVEISSPKSLTFRGDSSGHYLTTLAFRPKQESYPNKWDEWSTDSQTENPSQTLNLTPFVKLLYKAAISSNQNNSEQKLIFYINK